MTQQQKDFCIIRDGNKINNYNALERKMLKSPMSVYVYTLMLPLFPASHSKARLLLLCLKLDVMLFNVSEQVYNVYIAFTDVVYKFC